MGEHRAHVQPLLKSTRIRRHVTRRCNERLRFRSTSLCGRPAEERFQETFNLCGQPAATDYKMIRCYDALEGRTRLSGFHPREKYSSRCSLRMESQVIEGFVFQTFRCDSILSTESFVGLGTRRFVMKIPLALKTRGGFETSQT